MGTLSRIRYVMAANVNALLEKAENPEKLLRALIREMEDAGEDARMAVADLLAEQQHMERESVQVEREIVEWQDRAETAVSQQRDDLARAALKARAELQERQDVLGREREMLAGRVAQLESDMTTLKGKLAEARQRLNEIQSRGIQQSATASRQDPASRNERKIRQAMSRFDRLQRQVERLEARVRSYEVGGVAPSPWVNQDQPADPMIEAELEELKKRINKPATAGSPGQANGKAADSVREQAEVQA